MISLSKFFKENQLSQIVALVLLLLLLLLGGLPGYLTGHWQWKQPPSVTKLTELRHIRKTGLSLPGWQTLEQSEQQIGERKWSLQVIKQEGSETQVIVLLLPQNGPMDQPEVEWTEVNGWGRSRWGKWEVAQYRSAEFNVKPSPKLNSKTETETKVQARFFRAATPQQTFAVLQWYALPDGGSPSPFHWFIADQLAQWNKKRTPWVGISIIIPMEPLGQVEKSWTLAQSVGKTVQTTLMAGPLIE